MPKESKSKSGLFNILRVNTAKSKFDTTEIEIRIPKFQNFGQGLAELEHQAEEFQRKLEAEITPEEQAKAEAEAETYVADMAKTMRATATESKKESDNMAGGMKKDAMNLLAKMMEDAAAMMESEPDEAEPEAESSTKQKSSAENLELLTVIPVDDTKWDANAEAKVDELIRNWPDIRPQLLKRAHAYYKDLYPELKDIFGDMPTFKFIMPEPDSPKAVEDIFSIRVIYIRDDDAIGVSGSCTWDDEHGFGGVIKHGQVIAFGHADEGFC